MQLPTLLLLATATGVAPGVSARVFDSVPAVPQGWTKVAPAEPTDKLSLHIALRQQHAGALEQAVLAISTPGSPDYGKHLTREALAAYVAPSPQTVDAVTRWLAAYGIVEDSSSDNSSSLFALHNEFLMISTDVATADELLDAEFAWYEYEDGNGRDGRKLRTLSYSVPDEVAAHVDMIQPTTRFGQLGAKRSTIFDMTILDEVAAEAVKVAAATEATAVDAAAACTSTVTPACLKAQYNINYTASPEGNLVAFASYLEQYARYSDLQTFEEQQVPAAVGQNFSVTLINGGLNDQSSSEDSGEANLDVQYVLGTSSPIPILEYSTGGRGPLVPTLDNGYPSTNEPYLDFLNYVLNLTDAELPQTLTTSYGEEEQSVPEDFALKVCDLFMQLGGRGVSVLFSSGDSGPGGSCKSNVDNTTTTFLPTFPAGCPYVTAVGATTGSAPERAVSFSSGGFSIYHSRPSWQDAAVSPYVASIGETYAGLYNATGRGIPDVAAQGYRFVVIDKARTASLSGTSASSPVFAGVVALLNAARKSQGQSPLGFLNPWLYNNSAALLDITSGYSSGCSGAGGGLPTSGARWNATAGWDPVTGLGTPLFDQLLAIAAPGVANA